MAIPSALGERGLESPPRPDWKAEFADVIRLEVVETGVVYAFLLALFKITAEAEALEHGFELVGRHRCRLA